jgi:4-diphosphocytidyl-2-C-methyl-D-erythritol kinase
MITYPNAKINLGLHVVSRRSDGFHNIETVFYPIPLQDALEVKDMGTDSKEDTNVQITGSRLDCSIDENLAVKVYRFLQEKYSLPKIQIYLYKHIPVGAGLGGGSSDAAFMMKLLNDKYKLGLSDTDMQHLITSLGADCAFFIENKPKFATGIGDVFTPIGLSLKGYYLLLVKPEVSINTAEAYKGITPKKPELDLQEIVKIPIEQWKDLLKNDFETTIFPHHPEIAAIKDKMYDLGALYASMSGSGSTVYGLFKQPIDHAENIFSGYFCRQRALDI